MTSVQNRIRAKCDGVANALIEETNNSHASLDPARIFCRGRASDLLRVRIDGQLSCIAKSKKASIDEEVKELVRSLILLLLVLEDEGEITNGNTQG